MLSPPVTAMAFAARQLGYRGVGDLVELEQLTSARVRFVFGMSASSDQGVGHVVARSPSLKSHRDCVTVLLAGSIASYRCDPKHWRSEPVRSVAIELLADERNPQAVFAKLSDKAAKIVKALNPDRYCGDRSAPSRPTPAPAELPPGGDIASG